MGFRFASCTRIHANRDETTLPGFSPWLGTYCVEDLETKKQESLHTRNKTEAYRLVAARNETDTAPAFSLQLARVYWKAGIPPPPPAIGNSSWELSIPTPTD